MKNYKSKLLLILFLLFLSSHNIYGISNAVSDSLLSELDSYIENAVQQHHLPGLAIALVKGDSVIFANGYGLKNTDTEEPVNTGTLFAIASITKAFTATCINMLADDGKLDLDDKVVEHFPEFQLHDPYITQNMTIRDLLCHRSGFDTFDGDLLWYGTDYTVDEVLHRLRNLPIKNEFRYTYGYQNLMFITAGKVIENVSGMPYTEFLKKRILEPLGMTNTLTSISEFEEGMDISSPHLEGEVIDFLNYDGIAAAGCLNSSVDDMSKWIAFWLNKGVVDGDTLLTENAWRTILSTHTPMAVSPFQESLTTHFRAYGLGWFLFDYQGRKIIEHGGGLPGFISKISIVPEEDFGMIILTNDMSSLASALEYKVLDVMFGIDGRDWSGDYFGYYQSYLEREEAKREDRRLRRIPDTKPSKALELYAGSYEDEYYGKAIISYDDEELVLQLLPAKELFTSEMTHWHYNTFRIKFNDPFLPEGFVTFSFNTDGEIVDFSIDLPNPDFNFYNLTFKKID